MLLMRGSFGLGTGLGVYLRRRSEVDDIDDALRFALLAAIISARRSAAVPAFLLDVVPQVPLPHKVLQVRLEAFALVSSIPALLVISTELALVPGGGVTLHRLRLLKEGLRLYFVEELIDGLLEDRVYCLEGGSIVPSPPAAPRGCGRGGGVPSTT
ncbi:hypothetical protein AAC387_Pa02g1263 [Persea americana]